MGKIGYPPHPHSRALGKTFSIADVIVASNAHIHVGASESGSGGCCGRYARPGDDHPQNRYSPEIIRFSSGQRSGVGGDGNTKELRLDIRVELERRAGFSPWTPWCPHDDYSIFDNYPNTMRNSRDNTIKYLNSRLKNINGILHSPDNLYREIV